MDTSFMDFSYFVIMFMVALVAGFINVVSGGGGFLSIGALLISGLPPANALATNKIQALGSSLTSGIYFLRRGTVGENSFGPDPLDPPPPASPIVIGA